MRSTIKDVARLAGVAPSTVSRVIQNASSISEPTKKRVRQAMEELSYYPNQYARGLVSRKTQAMGLILPNESAAFYRNPFFAACVKGINDEASQCGYTITLSSGSDLNSRIEGVKRLVLGRQVDGLIFLYSDTEDPILKYVIDQHFPSVVIGKPDSYYMSFVDNDNQRAAYDATKALIERGAKQLTFIGGMSSLVVVQDRLAGFKRAMEEAGLEVKEDRIISDFRFASSVGERLAKEMVEAKRHDAFLFVDELVAQGFQQAWYQLTDLPLLAVTFKSFPAEPFITGSFLPYVDIHVNDLGRTAVKLLKQVISDGEDGVYRYYHEIIPHDFVLSGRDLCHSKAGLKKKGQTDCPLKRRTC
ncbi:LacI family DNA-binding transcriptional regulator [Atopobacter sp. AH10]|uniref:LacI family DNA-binding transcriptional regulator n=1 Tax=Atopobacter sp. AH10 TaxID=2315861 RepID=UPI000EF28490|nr:LacI family DNA-binding transcriptional regulator [Atopobacter sp. AH10]RLK64215.1 LacI family DNA-binding transcriptional regulator [Atopobacter sp. AH10]